MVNTCCCPITRKRKIPKDEKVKKKVEETESRAAAVL